MLSWSQSKRNPKPLYGVEELGSQYVEQTYQFSTEETVALSDAVSKDGQVLKIEGIHRFCKKTWKERPSWMRTVYSGKEGDNTVLETLVNVATSVPFVLIGLRVPRKSLSTTMYSNSLIGVGMASTLYHTSRGEARKGTRWGDYAMIATSTVCMSAAVQQDYKHPRALMLASIMMLPFQPLLVTAIHTALAEATFAKKVIKNPKLRGAHALHAVTSLAGGALFVADDMYPDAPYIHAAWHVAAAVDFGAGPPRTAGGGSSAHTLSALSAGACGWGTTSTWTTHLARATRDSKAGSKKYFQLGSSRRPSQQHIQIMLSINQASNTHAEDRGTRISSKSVFHLPKTTTTSSLLRITIWYRKRFELFERARILSLFQSFSRIYPDSQRALPCNLMARLRLKWRSALQNFSVKQKTCVWKLRCH